MGQIKKGAGCASLFLFLLDFVFGIFWPDDARGIAGKQKGAGYETRA
ncbi:MAG: hypothetical protein ABSC15_16100 [Terriglobales bacterium]|jgi:hypothetical protein